jgi:hypothetical protein
MLFCETIVVQFGYSTVLCITSDQIYFEVKMCCGMHLLMSDILHVAC